MQPKEYINLIKRWAWLLIIGILVGGGGGKLYSYFQTEIYQASTKIIIMNSPESSSLDVSYQNAQQLAQTYIELIVTRPVLEATSEILGYKVFANQIQISNEQLIKVTVDDEDPAHAADIANTLVTTFLDQNDIMQTSRYASSEASLQAQIQQVEAQIADLQSQLGEDAINTQETKLQTITDIIASLQTEISDLQREIITLQYQDELVEVISATGLRVMVTPTPSLDELIEINRQSARLTELQTLLPIYQGIYVDLSYATENIATDNNGRIAQIQSALGLYQQIYSNLLSNYETIRLARLKSTPNIVQVEKALPPTNPIRPKTMNNILIGAMIGFGLMGILAFLIEYLDESIRDTATINDVLQLPVLGYIGDMGSNKSSGNNFIKFKFFIFWNSPFINSIKSSLNKFSKSLLLPKSTNDLDISNEGLSDINLSPVVESHSEQDITLPQDKNEFMKQVKTMDQKKPIVLKHPRSPITEAFRSLRNNLDFTSLDKPLKTLLITSSGIGEGKTTVAVNLALVMAQSGKRIVLLDADLRRPKVHEKLNLSNRQGLSDMLRLNMKLDEVSQVLHPNNLTVITSGSLPPNPAEVLGSEKMTKILEELKNQFDVVVLDGVPYMLADASILASKVDGVLVVIRSRVTTQSMAIEMLEQIDRVGARVIGAVFNCIRNDNRIDYYQSLKGYSNFSYETDQKE